MLNDVLCNPGACTNGYFIGVLHLCVLENGNQNVTPTAVLDLSKVTTDELETEYSFCFFLSEISSFPLNPSIIYQI